MEYASHGRVRLMKRLEEYLERDETGCPVDLVSALRGPYANDDRERARLRTDAAASIALSILVSSRFAKPTQAIEQPHVGQVTDVLRCWVQNRYLSYGGEMMLALAEFINAKECAGRSLSSDAIPFWRTVLQRGTSLSAVRLDAG